MLETLKQLPTWLRLGVLFPVAFLNAWLVFALLGYFQPLSSLVMAAALLAFLLNLPIRLLSDRGLRRGWAIALVLGLTLVFLGIGLLVVIPLIISQLNELLINLPQWIKSSNQQLISLQEWANSHQLKYNLDLSQVLSQGIEKISGLLNSLGNQVFSLVGITINTIFNGLLLLVLTIFLVITGEQVWDGIFSWIPTPWNQRLRESLRETFERYFATQAILAGILSAAQMVVFIVLQVPYAILFAVTIGLTTLIPYASGLTILAISLLLMLQNFWLGFKVLIAAIIVGQINDNIISPRLMGNMTGLNPVWIVISLFIGGKLAGVLGLLVAVPFASVIKNTVDNLRYSDKKGRQTFELELTEKETSLV
ncbi:MAG: AI-2E family transporter [Microcystaceae cyanobacterium]